MIVSPPLRQPVALQWRISVPAGVGLEPNDIKIGDAAEAAGKTITCAKLGETTKKDEQSMVVCILAGGKKAIADGPLASVRITLPSGLHSARVLVHEVIGVSPDLKRVDIQETEGTVSVN
jgi:hypothetical protein